MGFAIPNRRWRGQVVDTLLKEAKIELHTHGALESTGRGTSGKNATILPLEPMPLGH